MQTPIWKSAVVRQNMIIVFFANVNFRITA